MNLLDTNYQVETPEGIDLYAQVAGPVSRAYAYLIDLSIRAVFILVVSMMLVFAGEAGMGVILLVSFFVEWFYPIFFEVYRNGQTPGKKRMQLTVVNDDLTPINFGTSLIRNLIRAVDFLPFFYLGGLLSMVISHRFQRLGDLAAGTLVIHVEPKQEKPSLPDIIPRSPNIRLSISDQIAIIGFAQRHAQLSESRQQELADIVKDVIGSDSDQTVEHLQGMGCWLLGGGRQ